jgi:hypothetical protein
MNRKSGRTATEFKILVKDMNTIRCKTPDRKEETVQVDLNNWQEATLEGETIKIFRDWLARGKITTRDELEVFGSYLYKLLFRGNISTLFQETYTKFRKDNAQGEGKLRVVLEFSKSAADLANLPWEYVFVPKDENKQASRGYFIGADEQLVLIRHVPAEELVQFKSTEPTESKLRILLVISQPDDDILGEVKAVKVMNSIEELRTKFQKIIETDILQQPTMSKFAAKIKHFRPHVLHFIGHGKYDTERRGQLAFVTDDNKAHWLNDKSFADFFMKFQPHLVFLHACEGAYSESYGSFRGIALQLLSANIPAVVAMQYPIENRIATEFTKKFYQCLSEAKTLDIAVQLARLELGMYLQEGQTFSSRAFGSPVVYLQTSTGIIVPERMPDIPIQEPKDEIILSEEKHSS